MKTISRWIIEWRRNKTRICLQNVDKIELLKNEKAKPEIIIVQRNDIFLSPKEKKIIRKTINKLEIFKKSKNKKDNSAKKGI